MEYIYKSAGILIQDKKLLVTKGYGKDIYIAPGGKREAGESSEQALVRELEEEVCIKVYLKDMTFFGSFEALAAGQEDKTVIMDVYLIKQRSNEIIANNEIESLKRITSKDVDTMHIGSIFAHEVIPKLYQKGLIK